MDKIWAFRVVLTALTLATFATSAEAMPAGSAPAKALVSPTVSEAGVTIGRHKALPKKKRIHRERKL
ncbi:hypothetical protein [Methylorubrum rhodesianum]|uniref:Uncharacterized protein n=1 Tax=Methylorubrum rhodesianum TaxID=29427 RepID=A0ABU9Z556_9HYPH|nr:hypothetical protein [Methylorubrum rhodesianum]MBK3403264.1 hypothetical protein [Methylorubrum rhodesianum]MBY0143348.1 hypothetical protein [Methylorubrum populi]